jgi:hypothetical protein
MTRTLPRYGWIGLAIVLVSQAATLRQIEPFYHWHTPIAWTGYILLADAVVWKRRGSSWLRNSPGEMFFLALVSIPLWVIFELYNKYALHNWYYVGLPDPLLLRYFGYMWAFATISPAIFETGDLVSSLRDRRASTHRADRPLPPTPTWPGISSVLAGAAMLVVPLLFPSPYFAAPVFLGFIFLLDPINAWAGDQSIMEDRAIGTSDRLINLLVAGLVCGLLWEAWNYWAGCKWIYSVPILPRIKVFEMPILGFAGFPPFAVECFVMYVAVRRWIFSGTGRAISV